MDYKKVITKVTVLASLTAFIGASVLMPTAFAASDSKDTTINAIIGSSISLTTSTTVNLNITPTASGSATSAMDSVKVSTNNTAGYNLQLADKDATVTLTKGVDTIAATSGTFAAPAAMGANSWGWRVDGAGTFGAGVTTAQNNAASLTGTWAAMPASGSPVTIASTSATAVNEETKVWYGAFIDSSKPNGTYTDVVTYTATTK